MPLIPHLRGVGAFAEPCAGDGALIRHLESFRLRCVYAGDIATGRDALDLTPADINDADTIITNPPFSRESRPLLRRLIAHFLRIASTVWLLFPADFASNQWFAPFLPQCSDIVPIGRVRWFEGTEGNSYDNFAWYRFDARHSAGPIFHANGAAPEASRVSSCSQCNRPYRPQRSDSKFCSNACRQRAYRERPKRNASVTRDTDDEPRRPHVGNARGDETMSSEERKEGMYWTNPDGTPGYQPFTDENFEDCQYCGRPHGDEVARHPAAFRSGQGP